MSSCHMILCDHQLYSPTMPPGLSSQGWGSSYLSETASVGKKGKRKGHVEGLGEEGEGRECRPHLFMLSISMGGLVASL